MPKRRSEGASSSPSHCLRYLIRHVFLPPQLPQEDDFDPTAEMAMATTVLDGLREFKSYVPDHWRGPVDSAIALLENFHRVHSASEHVVDLDDEDLGNVLSDLCGKGGSVPLYISAQNAGVIIYKMDHHLHVEAFELSPLNSAIVGTKGRVKRSFPGTAVSIDNNLFRDSQFRSSLSSTLVKMSQQSARGTLPQVRKAGGKHDETRDTAHPKMVTELLVGFLMSLGTSASVSTILKHTWDEVLWDDCFMPWRRSRTWLLLRVALQLTFCRSRTAANLASAIYKGFMVFLLAYIMGKPGAATLDSDLLSAMNAKVARRLRKMGNTTNASVRDFVHIAMGRHNALLQERWGAIQMRDPLRINSATLAGLDFEKDTLMNLPLLNEYIISLEGRDKTSVAVKFEPTATLTEYAPAELPPAPQPFAHEYAIFDVAGFEAWVAARLPAWIDAHSSEKKTCRLLASLIRQYHPAASLHTSNNPEAYSVMVLTIMDLWTACDISAVKTCPLLRDYDPGIPVELLQNLLLPFKSQMARLHRIELYISDRRSSSHFPSPKIFCDFGNTNDSFPVRYFNDSVEHANLFNRIESFATMKRQEKIREFQAKKDEYASLMREYDLRQCDMIKRRGKRAGREVHSDSCQRHSYLNKAKSLSIKVHEWPLPSQKTKAKSVIFELLAPEWFNEWRDATLFLKFEVLQSEYTLPSSPGSLDFLGDYEGLSSFPRSFNRNLRVGVLSEFKPHARTHRRGKEVASASQQSVCLNNGLNFRYYDNRTGYFITDISASERVPQNCTYKMPPVSEALQQFLFRPAANPDGPPPNVVIAAQSECPMHMSLAEYRALCSLPLGCKIQWQNILVQLRAPSVDFRKTETVFTILQCIHQAGPHETGGVLRDAHAVFDDSQFAGCIVDGLVDASKRLGENWQSSEAFAVFIALATRVFSLTSSSDIRQKCLDFLAAARQTTYDWVKILRDKAQDASGDDARIALRSRAVRIALICVSSLDVDENYLSEVLLHELSASIFLQCSIVIREGEQAMGSPGPLTALLYWRWKRLCYRTYPVLASQTRYGKSHALDDAIQKSWSAYEPQGRWKQHSKQHGHWLITQTDGKGDRSSLSVQFNLLTGELLVNGTPLDRLPAAYENHPLYPMLFGRAAIEVMPTNVPGMQFSGKREYADHVVHFSLGRLNDYHDDHDLLVRAVKDKKTYELVPSRLLRGLFPTSFVKEYAHWYHVDEGKLEFRPLDHPWTSSSRNWSLSRDPMSSWRLEKDGELLVAVESETAEALARILSPLEDRRETHLILNKGELALNIELPRIRLGFSLSQGSSFVKSRQFRGMCIDEGQSVGTLVGLTNKLVLVDEKFASRRLVVIPHGRVSAAKTDSHVSVTIGRGTATKAQAYRVNSLLGRLEDNGSLQSKLLLCYLHALTSFCLPDPLTKRTGTEEALSILRSASVKSFYKLTQDDIHLLTAIARITPSRACYPVHERVMQTVKWNANLGFLSQHDGFHVSVKEIFQQASRLQFFHPDSYIISPRLSDHIDPHLLRRNELRTSAFRVSGFGAESHTVEYDLDYQPRDRGQGSCQTRRVFDIASIVFHEQPLLHSDFPKSLAMHIYRLLSKNDVLDIHTPLPQPIGYDSQWLSDSSEFVNEHWSCLHHLVSRQETQLNKFDLILWLATLAFSDEADLAITQMLASLSAAPELSRIVIPAGGPFHLSNGFSLLVAELRQCIENACVPFHLSPEAPSDADPSESDDDSDDEQWQQFKHNKTRAVQRLVDNLKAQWPCERPSRLRKTLFSPYINKEKAMGEIIRLFKTWHDNLRFVIYLRKLESAAPSSISSLHMPVPSLNPSVRHNNKHFGFVGIGEIFTRPVPFLPVCTSNLSRLLSPVGSDSGQAPRLSSLIAQLDRKAASAYERDYVQYLRSSLQSLKEQKGSCVLQTSGWNLRELLGTHLERCHEHASDMYNALYEAAAGIARDGAHSTPTVPDIEQLPRLSPIFFLQCLTRSRWTGLPEDWKKSIVRYGMLLTKLQRAERMFGCYDNKTNLINELQHEGHTNWDPYDYPESLLLEIENGILIREVQETIAQHMRTPESGKNALMQLNMGEGKSSVIVPIVASALADGNRLVRVIVTKPQAPQMFHMLVSKVAGLLDRQVYHLPFSRSVKMGKAEGTAIQEILLECMSTGGVLLVQPEHMLSFRLMALERAILGDKTVGGIMLQSQKFLNTSSRDIIDESDEILSVKFELVYTMGMQRPVDYSPNRWTCIQEVLEIFRKEIIAVKSEFPQSVELHSGHRGSFHRTRILRPDAWSKIMEMIARQICSDGLTGLGISQQSTAVKDTVYNFITVLNITSADIEELVRQVGRPFWEGAKNTLLLVRGLLASGVLAFVFGQKRWRVNYGLDPNRRPETKLAVPYRAKDNPSARSEFSHPDVVITLTSLSYYYGGLSDEFLFLAFGHLFESDQADLEYQAWVADANNLHDAFRQLGGINTDDHFQCVEKVFPCLRYAKAVVDYFLAHIVFPKEMKEFPDKLSASGWDVGEAKTHQTTGFSGTNDSRNVLPLTVEQLDLPDQKHTNALVLEYLLRPENSVALVPPVRPSKDASDSEADKLLNMVVVMEPPVRVILDVGAQILELDNLGVSEQWLEKLTDHEKTQAVVFFNENDHACVLDREGRIESLHTSPYAAQLDVCLVFLDEAHTRGTDLKLPEDYRAAVTLGASLTKTDWCRRGSNTRLACMRMRRLGKGQSVVFCVPEEIRAKIQGPRVKQTEPNIVVQDILDWAISETWLDTRRSIPLWAVQGRRHREHHKLWAKAWSDGDSGQCIEEIDSDGDITMADINAVLSCEGKAESGCGISMTESDAKQFLEEEARSLDDMYHPRPPAKDQLQSGQAPEDDDPIAQKCLEFNALEMELAALQEEQERELSPEIEQERQVQRPPAAKPADHDINSDIRKFVGTGKLPESSPACIPAFTSLSGTSAAKHLNLAGYPRDGLLVTADFARTVKAGASDISDSYQRPVQWILTSGKPVVKHMIIISPYEANKLLPDIKKSKVVTLRLYAPRPNLGYRALDTLDLYSMPKAPVVFIPRRFTVELNLFSGQLYVGSYEEYVAICRFIGVPWRSGGVDDAEKTNQYRLEGNPVEFLRVLMTRIRRNCQGIEKTHIGRVLDGRFLLSENLE